MGITQRKMAIEISDDLYRDVMEYDGIIIGKIGMPNNNSVASFDIGGVQLLEKDLLLLYNTVKDLNEQFKNNKY